MIQTNILTKNDMMSFLIYRYGPDMIHPVFYVTSNLNRFRFPECGVFQNDMESFVISTYQAYRF